MKSIWHYEISLLDFIFEINKLIHTKTQVAGTSRDYLKFSYKSKFRTNFSFHIYTKN